MDDTPVVLAREDDARLFVEVAVGLENKEGAVEQERRLLRQLGAGRRLGDATRLPLFVRALEQVIEVRGDDGGPGRSDNRLVRRRQFPIRAELRADPLVELLAPEQIATEAGDFWKFARSHQLLEL